MADEHRTGAAVAYAVIAFIAGVVFAIVNPPFRTPDEVGHYWRAEAMAGGRFLPPLVNGRPTADVPWGVRHLVATLWKPAPSDRFTRHDFQSAATVPLERDRPVPVTFPAYYTPLPYLPQAIACGIGRLSAVRPLYTFYAGRILNLLTMIALFVAAMRILPEAAPIIMAIGLLPMTLYLGASFSPDACTIGLCVCMTALSLRPMPRVRLLLATAVAVALSKPVYFATNLLAVAIPPDRFASRRRALLAKSAVVVVTVMCVATSALMLRETYYRIRTDVPTDPPLQARRVISSPLAFVATAVRDDASHAYEYAAQFVGNLGSLDVPLPRAAVNVELVLLVLVAATSRLAITVLQRIAAAIATLITVLLVSLSQYIIWTPLGADSIDGIQGRYFLPIALTAAAVFSGTVPLRLRKDFVVVCVVAIVVNAIAVAALVRHYY